MKGTYRTDPSTEAQVTVLELGDGRHFLVARFRIREWKTIVFEHLGSPDCWISRRDIDGYFEAEAAVSGHILQTNRCPDPVTQMKRDLDTARRSYWSLHNELIKLKSERAVAKVNRKRGVAKHGRRNP